jgi:very-short-patch-repair endonuclease
VALTDAVFADRSRRMLQFLSDVNNLRRSRLLAYDPEHEHILWFADLPDNRGERQGKIQSPFLFSGEPRPAGTGLAGADLEEFEAWLTVARAKLPDPPAVPQKLVDWVPQKFLDDPQSFLSSDGPTLENLVLEQVVRPGSSGGPPRIERFDADPARRTQWQQFLQKQWLPWAEKMRALQPLADLHRELDYMRNRLLEGEEIYELLVAAGLLVWVNDDGDHIERHVLVAPARIESDPATGTLQVVPADPLQGFRLELDMLAPAERPQVPRELLDQRLEELDVAIWDVARVEKVLGLLVANAGARHAKFDASARAGQARPDRTMRFYWAPALVLRRRRQTGFEQMAEKLLETVAEGDGSRLPQPWKMLIAEGEHVADDPAAAEVRHTAAPDGRLYFPLKTSEEQRKIAARWQCSAGVVVKGPPGTGKSQTIANLICHLLSVGERVLITAHAGKALEVLGRLLPKPVLDLCVGAFGLTRDDDRRLAESVERMQQRRHRWDPAQARRGIAQLEQELQRLEREQQSLEAALCTARRAETEPVQINEDYAGTLADLARRVAEAAAEFNWFPPPANPSQRSCPLTNDELAELASLHASLTPAIVEADQGELGGFDLPQPAEFAALLEEWKKALAAVEKAKQRREDVLAELTRELPPERVARLRTALGQTGMAELDALVQWLEQLHVLASEVSRRLAADPEPARRLCRQIVHDLAAGRGMLWRSREADLAELQQRLEQAIGRSQQASVTFNGPFVLEILHADACRRRDHFRRGGRRGFGPLAPRVVRETRYIERICRVNGQPPRSAEALDALAAHLEIRQTLERFAALWPERLLPAPELQPALAAELIAGARDGLRRLLEHLARLDSFFLPVRLAEIDLPADLSDDGRRLLWRDLLAAERDLRVTEGEPQRLEQKLAGLGEEIAVTLAWAGNRVHSCVLELKQAIEARDPDRYRLAWERREVLRVRRPRVRRWSELLHKLEAAHPRLARLLRNQPGSPDWEPRLRNLRRAWNWADARDWLERHVGREAADLAAQAAALQQNIERVTGELVVERAWVAFLERTHARFWQMLQAWVGAMRRVGKGTGRNAARHRRQARHYMAECLPVLPAWILPLHRVWDAAPQQPGAFDTIIVDEASQAGTEALLLFYLGKKIIVVGDDMQNTPDRVGISEDDVLGLARQYLPDFRFHAEFRPDTSLYDHALRVFGSVISLREHFRCVPEIIRFSNDLCYAGASLIPLRQPPPRRLVPLVDVYVRGGRCRGEGSHVVNDAEAHAVVRCIEECLRDPAYADKTMGVIALQGHRQAERIEELLRDRIPPQEIEKRRLRCGPPASFQGDERDVIFLSLVMSPDRHFRALTELDDRRRFNVAMSRARDQVWLVRSLDAADTSGREDDVRWRLLKFFASPGAEDFGQLEERERLEHAVQTAGRNRRPGTQPTPYESWFEVDVALELLRRHYRVRPQVSVAGYRIDLVIEGLHSRLAVECDGEAWHGLERFQQDLYRQRQLERAGWRFCRLRESEFYLDRAAAINRIVQNCRALDIEPMVAPAAPPGTVRRVVYDADELLREHRPEHPEPQPSENQKAGKSAPSPAPTTAATPPQSQTQQPAEPRVVPAQLHKDNDDNSVVTARLLRTLIDWDMVHNVFSRSEKAFLHGLWENMKNGSRLDPRLRQKVLELLRIARAKGFPPGAEVIPWQTPPA